MLPPSDLKSLLLLLKKTSPCIIIVLETPPIKIYLFLVYHAVNVFAQQKPAMKNMSKTDAMDHGNMPGMNMKTDTVKPGKKGMENIHMPAKLINGFYNIAGP